MVNSKGGFLIEDGKEVDEDTLRKEKERERQRIQKNMEPRTSQTLTILVVKCRLPLAVYLDPALNPKCRECQSISIDHDYKKVFGCLVCKTCQHAMPEKYSLLTKTECKQVSGGVDTATFDDDIRAGLSPDGPCASDITVLVTPSYLSL
jgi:DNA-repair protein complementing XP-A cells